MGKAAAALLGATVGRQPAPLIGDTLLVSKQYTSLLRMGVEVFLFPIFYKEEQQLRNNTTLLTNSNIALNHYPTLFEYPNIALNHNTTRRKLYLSKMDVVNAFHCIELAESDAHKTAFQGIHGEKYHYVRGCFGLRYMPYAFQMCIDSAIGGNKANLAYFDDRPGHQKVQDKLIFPINTTDDKPFLQELPSADKDPKEWPNDPGFYHSLNLVTHIIPVNDVAKRIVTAAAAKVRRVRAQPDTTAPTPAVLREKNTSGAPSPRRHDAAQERRRKDRRRDDRARSVLKNPAASAGRPYQQAAAPPPAPAPAPAPQRASPGPSLEDITAPLPPPPSWSPGLDADITDLAISLGLYSAPAPTYGYLTAAPGGAPTTPAVGTAPMDPGAEGPSALPSTGPAADAGYTIAEGPSAPPSADPAAAAALPAGPGAGRLHTPDTSSPSDAPATPRAATMGESSGLADRASVPPINFVVREVLRATAAMVAGHMAGATKTVTDIFAPILIAPPIPLGFAEPRFFFDVLNLLFGYRYGCKEVVVLE
ncbi:Retrovirus-related Pol polyprotein from transposon 297, partial [Frankliniella fusca]